MHESACPGKPFTIFTHKDDVISDLHKEPEGPPPPGVAAGMHDAGPGLFVAALQEYREVITRLLAALRAVCAGAHLGMDIDLHVGKAISAALTTLDHLDHRIKQASAYSRFQCPRCGWWPNTSQPEQLVLRTKAVRNDRVSDVFGVEALDWEETWRCPTCKAEFSFINSNC